MKFVKLHPCKSCGEDDVYLVADKPLPDEQNTHWRVKCSNCGAHSSPSVAIHETVDDWNENYGKQNSS